MGYDYALVHLVYTIPPAAALTLLYWPLFTRLDVYKTLFLVSIAVVSTTPWDSYLIRARIWTYPENAIIGPTLFRIPFEELFFFVVQTYTTTLLYLLVSKPTLHPIYLRTERGYQEGEELRLWKNVGKIVLIGIIIWGARMVVSGGEGVYIGLIIVWAGPFLLLLWSLAYQLIIGLPLSNTFLPVALSTLYLWIVDTLALRRGTWVIESGTKVGLHLWDGLEIEEAVFFLATNTLIVFGLVAFDNAVAILEAFPSTYPSIPALPAPTLLVKALLLPASQYDVKRITGLSQALVRLQKKSRSFYLASGVFQGRLRIDLILLYSFCRVADDLIDNASSVSEARNWIDQLSAFLDIAYKSTDTVRHLSLNDFVTATFPAHVHSALQLLPISYLPSAPLYSLLRGFETDLEFSPQLSRHPIQTEADLETYAARVAGTVAELCLELVYHHTKTSDSSSKRKRLTQAGGRMGIALQYVNIARDIAVDARIGRVYLPTSWLSENNLSPGLVLEDPESAKVEKVRSRLLDEAMRIYRETKGAIEELPPEARGPMRVAVESYIEIGRVLTEKDYRIKAGRATVPKMRRLKVAWHSLSAGVGGVATAARLAKAGFKVTVLEKNGFTGGRCSLIHSEGYRFDQGPSLLLLPKLFEEVFNDLDTSLDAEDVHLMKCEPNYNLWFSDGEAFELSTDVARMKNEVEKWEGKDGFERYLGFLQEAHRHYELSVTHVLKKNFTSLLSMARPSFLLHLLELHPFESIYSRASKYFWTERLRRVFTFGSMYMGMSPFDAPGTYSLLQYTELAEGIWYPKGGFHRVIQALVDVGSRLGVDYRLNTPVARIDLDPVESSSASRAGGVTLESGEQLDADVVVINADLVYAYNNLLPPSPRAVRLQKRDASCSSINFYWAMDRVIPELKVHNIFLADDYRESFDDIFKHQLIPKEPSFYVNVPSRVDETAAPKGKDAIVVLVPVGHLLDDKEGKGLNPQSKQDWEAMVSKARTTVFATIETRTGARGLREAVVKEIVNTPQSWKDTFNLDKGAILGLSHSFFNVLSFRPSTKHSSIDRLHFVGASTHPGTGVPICLAGSKVTTEQILAEFQVQAPWRSPGRTRRKAAKVIDRVHYPPIFSYFDIALLMLVALWVFFIYWYQFEATCRFTWHTQRRSTH